MIKHSKLYSFMLVDIYPMQRNCTMQHTAYSRRLLSQAGDLLSEGFKLGAWLAVYCRLCSRSHTDCVLSSSPLEQISRLLAEPNASSSRLERQPMEGSLAVT